MDGTVVENPRTELSISGISTRFQRHNERIGSRDSSPKCLVQGRLARCPLMHETACDETPANPAVTNRNWVGKHNQLAHNPRIVRYLQGYGWKYAGNQRRSLQLFVIAAHNTASELRLRQRLRS